MKYRKKPIVIEAINWSGSADSWDRVLAFVGDRRLVQLVEASRDGFSRRAFVNTLEGRMELSVGDWVIRGVEGELYPCKPSIFDATYEVAE